MAPQKRLETKDEESTESKKSFSLSNNAVRESVSKTGNRPGDWP